MPLNKSSSGRDDAVLLLGEHSTCCKGGGRRSTQGVRLLMKIWTIALLIMLATLSTGCNRSYTAQYMAFPPDAVPHEKGWTYLCQVITWAQHPDPVCQRGPKRIEIIIQDTNGKMLLKDELKTKAAGTDIQISWAKFEDIRIDIYEDGNKYAEDEYNRMLVKSGPRPLFNITYGYNKSTGKFERRSLTNRQADG